MAGVLAIRRETKSPWERRSPLTPEMTRHIVNETNVEILVQPSPRRVFTDKEYVRAGATLTEDLSKASVIMGVKEVPEEMLLPDTAYVFFSHVVKGQAYNMGMLRRIMELGCTLIDYEKVRDDEDRRLIFFGRFAGLAGAIDSFWALGQRLKSEGIASPFADLEPSHAYDSLDDAKAAIRAAGEIIEKNGMPDELPPMIIAITGYGNVASGVREILAKLPTREIAPAEIAGVIANSETSRHCLYQVTFREEHLVEPRDTAGTFDLQDYYQRPERYRGVFASYLPHISVLMNCNYWDERYPRLVTKSEITELFDRAGAPPLRVIGDIGCDIEGAIECMVRTTEPGDPVYVWDTDTGEAPSGVEGHGPVILAVDILPAELPREASEEFSNTLRRFVPGLAAADYSASFADLALPPEIKRAVIVHRGELTPDFRYLEAHLAESG